MDTGSVLQVLSSFTANPIEASLQRALASAGVVQGVGFTQKPQMREYMVAPASDTEHILGTLVFLRVEDWLRDGLMSSAETRGDAWARQELQTRVREFAVEITILSYRGKPVWFMACPSTGWISEQGKCAPLCRTYTNLLEARIRNMPQVTMLNWPAVLSGNIVDDRQADRLQNVPFTQDVFDRLGGFVAGQIARTLARSDSSSSHTATGGSPELASYLAGLQVEVTFKPLDAAGRVHLDRIIRTAASFSLTGEKPVISDAEIDALLEAKDCVLISVSDRNANHGPSGMVIYRWSENALVVELMSLSCTVLGKQVEYAVLSALTQMAAERRCSRVVFEYRDSGRNQPMLSFLQSVSDRQSETQYVLPLDTADARITTTAVNPGAWKVIRATAGEESEQPSLKGIT